MIFSIITIPLVATRADEIQNRNACRPLLHYYESEKEEVHICRSLPVRTSIRPRILQVSKDGTSGDCPAPLRSGLVGWSG